jgi:hypothetical protein
MPGPSCVPGACMTAATFPGAAGRRMATGAPRQGIVIAPSETIP